MTRRLWTAALGAVLLAMGCKNPVDAALDAALDFSGVYTAPNGLTLEFDGENGIITSLGSSEWGPLGALEVGDSYLLRMSPTDVEGEYIGMVMQPRVFATGPLGTTYWAPHEIATANFRDGRLELSKGASGHTSFAYTGTASPTPPPTSPTPPPTAPPSGNGTVLLSEVVEGSRDSQTFFTITVPSGTTRLEVKMVNDNQYARNMGDLFVRRGSRPSVTRTPTYSWSADCASVEPNYDPEVCVFPRSGTGVTAGTYHIMVFGYHAYYGARLTATIWR